MFWYERTCFYLPETYKVNQGNAQFLISNTCVAEVVKYRFNDWNLNIHFIINQFAVN